MQSGQTRAAQITRSCTKSNIWRERKERRIPQNISQNFCENARKALNDDNVRLKRKLSAPWEASLKGSSVFKWLLNSHEGVSDSNQFTPSKTSQKYQLSSTHLPIFPVKTIKTLKWTYLLVLPVQKTLRSCKFDHISSTNVRTQTFQRATESRQPPLQFSTQVTLRCKTLGNF